MPQVRESYLELLRSFHERPSPVLLRWIEGATKLGEVGYRAPILPALVLVLKASKNTVDLIDVVLVIRREQKVQVDWCIGMGLYVKTKLYVRKNKRDVRYFTTFVALPHGLVCLNTEVVP